MTDAPLPAPQAPPPGGYNDFHPPPAQPVLDRQEYIRRVRSNIKRPGSAWRLCEITQPRSVHELIATVWPEAAPVSADVGLALTDAYADWIAAGKPTRRP